MTQDGLDHHLAEERSGDRDVCRIAEVCPARPARCRVCEDRVGAQTERWQGHARASFLVAETQDGSPVAYDCAAT